MDFALWGLTISKNSTMMFAAISDFLKAMTKENTSHHINVYDGKEGRAEKGWADWMDGQASVSNSYNIWPLKPLVPQMSWHYQITSSSPVVNCPVYKSELGFSLLVNFEVCLLSIT